jgi:hypothetical protein
MSLPMVGDEVRVEPQGSNPYLVIRRLLFDLRIEEVELLIRPWFPFQSTIHPIQIVLLP